MPYGECRKTQRVLDKVPGVFFGFSYNSGYWQSREGGRDRKSAVS